MSSFLKIALRNLLKGPSTEKYPFGETYEPKGLRGKIQYDPGKCTGCGICEHVCAGGAIHIEETADKSGLRFFVWHNSCAFCGLCQFYCPTKAILLTEDYHTAHLQEDKFKYAESGFVKYIPCTCCGEPMIPAAPEILKSAFGNLSEDVKELMGMCEKCRQKEYVRKGRVIK